MRKRYDTTHTRFYSPFTFINDDKEIYLYFFYKLGVLSVLIIEFTYPLTKTPSHLSFFSVWSWCVVRGPYSFKHDCFAPLQMFHNTRCMLLDSLVWIKIHLNTCLRIKKVNKLKKELRILYEMYFLKYIRINHDIINLKQYVFYRVAS